LLLSEFYSRTIHELFYRYYVIQDLMLF